MTLSVLASVSFRSVRFPLSLADKMEVHTLLCEESLRDTTMVIYLNWKADAQGRQPAPLLRNMVKSTISDDLEFHTSAFVDRSIIVVDEIEELQPYMLNLPHRLIGAGLGGPQTDMSTKKRREPSASAR